MSWFNKQKGGGLLDYTITLSKQQPNVGAGYMGNISEIYFGKG